MPKDTLRVVAPDEKPKVDVKPQTLLEAIAGGNYRQILLAQRREIAASLPEEKGPAKAALHRQLAIISKEIETIEAGALDGEGAVVVNTDDEAWDGTGY